MEFIVDDSLLSVLKCCLNFMMRSSNYENFLLLLERLSGVCISCTHGFMQSAHISLHAMFIHLHIECLNRCLNHCQHMMYGRFQALTPES